MNTTLKLALVAFLLVGTAGLASAQTAEQPPAPDSEMMMADRGDGDGHRGGWHRGKGHGERGGRMMRMIDANGDGTISEDEAAAMADRMYTRLDQNNDGFLDKSEFAMPHRHGGIRAWFGFGADELAAVQKVREDKFVALDADKDGKLTKAEFFAEAKGRLAAADTDKDGKVSPWEFRAAN
jgi:hypothetical protein